jgi:hypothetical protein
VPDRKRTVLLASTFPLPNHPHIKPNSLKGVDGDAETHLHL